MTMTTKVQNVTPEDARRMLAKNTNNRPIRQAWVEQIAALIKTGKWSLTHQGIALATGGRVLDGQHRLHAIALAGKTVSIQVTTGMDEALYRWIDGGKSRTTPDRIHLVDDPRINRIACSMITAYITAAVKGNANACSVDDVENCFLDMADAWVYVASAFLKGVRRITTAPIGAALANYYNHTQTKGVEFTQHLLTGEYLTSTHPAYVLREGLLQGRLHGIHENYWKAMAACRAHVEGRSITYLNAATTDFSDHVYNRMLWAREKAHDKARLTRTLQKHVKGIDAK